MLQHEQEQPLGKPAVTEIPAAHIRVTSEELAQAINALQASKDEAASCLAGTVPIGQVVEELKLDATPEEVWAQVQKQRAQAVAEKAAAEKAAAEKAAAEQGAAQKAAADPSHEAFHRVAHEVGSAAAQAILAAQAAIQAASAQAAAAQAAAAQAHTGAQAYARPRHRWRGRSRGRWWALIGIGCAIYGVTHGHLLNVHGLGSAASSSAIIRGDNRVLTSQTAGKDVAVIGSTDTITLQGDCPTLTITGNGNHVRVEGVVKRVIAVGSSNTVLYTQGVKPPLLQVGDGNRVGPSAP